MNNFPAWLQELQELLGDKLQVVPHQLSLEMLKLDLTSNESAIQPERFELPSLGVTVLLVLAEDDPRRALSELLIRTNLQQDYDRVAQNGCDDAEAVMLRLLAGRYASSEEWLQDAARVLDPQSAAGYFLCLQFEESHAGEEPILDGVEAFLSELGGLHKGMRFARYSPVLEPEGFTGQAAQVWAVFLPKVKPAQEDALMRELRSWVDLVSSELFLQLRIGVGSKCEEAASAYNCLQDSLFALLQGCRFRPEERVYHFHELGIIHLLAGLSEPAKDRFLDNLRAMHRRTELTPELKETAWSFMKNNLNITETARSLYLHRNSLMYRLERILEITELDLRRFEDAVLMWLCLHLLH